MSWPTTRLREHLERVAARHSITIHWVDSYFDAEAQEFTMDVWIPHPGSPQHYAVALHELGHCVDHDGRRNDNDPEACERAAWAWAFANSEKLVEQTMNGPVVRDFAEDCIRTHLSALV